MSSGVDNLELHLSNAKTEYSKQWQPKSRPYISSSSKEKQPDCPICNKQYKPYLLDGLEVGPNTKPCPVCGMSCIKHQKNKSISYTNHILIYIQLKVSIFHYIKNVVKI